MSSNLSASVSSEEYVKPPDRQDTMTSFYTTGSSKEVMGSTSTLQVIPPIIKHDTHSHVRAFVVLCCVCIKRVSCLCLAEFQ